MSDIRMFAQRLHLEYREIPFYVYEFAEGADPADMLPELVDEMRLRGAEVVRAHHSKHTSNHAPGDEVLVIGIERGADHRRWDVTLRRGEWLVIRVYRERVYEVVGVSRAEGEGMFRPVMPIIELRPGVL